MSQRMGTANQRRHAVSASLYVGNPLSAAQPVLAREVPEAGSSITLPVDEVLPYEGNPRRAPNPKYDEIKASIAVSGIRNPVTVTRRPGDTRFIVEAGGNTRLRAQQELWRETRDERFRSITVVFRPWRCESHVLVAHLIENEQRGDLSFWDKAMGIAALRRQLEIEQKPTLSLRALESELKGLGITVSHSLLNLYRYATERLTVLGEAIPSLSGVAVARLQPRLNLLRQYAKSRASMEEDELYAQICQPMFTRFADDCRAGQAFDVDRLCQSCEDALALAVGDTAEQLRNAVTLLAQAGTGQGDPVLSIQAPVDGTGNDGALQARHAVVTNPLSGESDAVATGGQARSGMAPAPASSLQSSRSATRDVTDRAAPGLPLAAQATAPVASPASRLHRAIVVFAQLAGVLDCVAPDPCVAGCRVLEWPADLSGLSPDRLRAWWLLALVDATLPLSERRNEAGEILPVPAPGGLAACKALAGELCELSLFLWLADARDEAASAWHDVMSACRGLDTPAGSTSTGAAQAASLSEAG